MIFCTDNESESTGGLPLWCVSLYCKVLSLNKSHNMKMFDHIDIFLFLNFINLNLFMIFIITLYYY